MESININYNFLLDNEDQIKKMLKYMKEQYNLPDNVTIFYVNSMLCLKDLSTFGVKLIKTENCPSIKCKIPAIVIPNSYCTCPNCNLKFLPE